MNLSLKRTVFLAFYYGIARHLPGSYKVYSFGAKKIRAWICKHLFEECGENVNIEHGAVFGSGRNIKIGSNSGIGVDCRIPRAVIGKNVMMGPEVMFIDQNHVFDDPDTPLQRQGHTSYGPIMVGDNSWIGCRAIVLPGKKIGKCAIIGAGAVVSKDVPDYAVIAGNPARVVKWRRKQNESRGK